MTYIFVVLLCLLSGCALIVQHFGAAASTVQMAQTVDAVKLVADTTSTVASGKTMMDHAVSKVMQKDCNTFRLIKGEEICIDTKPIMVIQNKMCS